MVSSPTESLEQQLDSFDPAQRRCALEELCRMAAEGRVSLPAAGDFVNVHAHTFFSYNARGWSPSKFAWLARKAGLAVAGIVDFDVLDGLEEFTAAGRLLGLKTCVSLESRVFFPEFATRVVSSPGEPGVAYHMGVGFARPVRHAFLDQLRATAERRTRELLQRVNAFLRPVELDYAQDVVPLSPGATRPSAISARPSNSRPPACFRTPPRVTHSGGRNSAKRRRPAPGSRICSAPGR